MPHAGLHLLRTSNLLDGQLPHASPEDGVDHEALDPALVWRHLEPGQGHEEVGGAPGAQMLPSSADQLQGRGGVNIYIWKA